MKTINLKKYYYPICKKDTFVEVPDEVADAIVEEKMCIRDSLCISVLGRFFFQWLMDISMSAKGFDIFRGYRLHVGSLMRKAPMGLSLIHI